jgi:homoserine dehydrogenase
LVAAEARRLEEGGLSVRYHAVVARHGSWEARGSPFDSSLIASLADGGSLDGTGTGPASPEGTSVVRAPSTQEIRDIIARLPTSGLRCVLEAIDVDYEAGEPAATFLADALRQGAHAISANKGPVVHKRKELLSLADVSGLRYLHESAVMDGVPIFSTWRGGFRPGGARLLKIRGALNSTTGMVLAGMERGETMAVSLRSAQDAGIAEADPAGDLSGMDCAVKVVALAVALGLTEHPFGLADVDVSGIEHVTQEQTRAALADGCKLRLVGGAELVDDGSCGPNSRAKGYVRVERLQPGDPLYGLEGADAAVTLHTDRLSPVTITQKGSVVEDTAFGLFADMLRACRPEPV